MCDRSCVESWQMDYVYGPLGISYEACNFIVCNSDFHLSSSHMQIDPKIKKTIWTRKPASLGLYK